MLVNIFLSDILTTYEAPWWNYPGFELWRFVNLFILLFAALYLHRRFGRPIGEALRLRRERIREELDTAQRERETALRKLEEIQKKLSGFDSEVSTIQSLARMEAEAEKARIKQETELKIEKLRGHAQREIESAAKSAKQDLRRFVAKQSVQLAENGIRRDILTADDARLINSSVEQLGRNIP